MSQDIATGFLGARTALGVNDWPKSIQLGNFSTQMRQPKSCLLFYEQCQIFPPPPKTEDKKRKPPPHPCQKKKKCACSFNLSFRRNQLSTFPRSHMRTPGSPEPIYCKGLRRMGMWSSYSLTCLLWLKEVVSVCAHH